jgi:hypothetical protein
MLTNLIFHIPFSCGMQREAVPVTGDVGVTGKDRKLPTAIFCLWRFGPIPCHGLAVLGGFQITRNRTPSDERSTTRRDFCMTTHNTHKRQTFMPPAGFEPTIHANESSLTPALDRAATETSRYCITYFTFRSVTAMSNVLNAGKYSYDYSPQAVIS